MPEDSQLLLGYAHEGRLESLAALVDRHSKWLAAFLRGLLPTRADAEDAAQETWLRVIRFCESYRGGSVRAYLVRVARSVVSDRFRRAGVPTVSLDAEDDEGQSAVDGLADGASPPDEAFATEASAQEIRKVVRELPSKMREVFLMRVEGGLSFQEIAEQLEIPLGTTLTWMRRATIRLRKRLRADRPERVRTRGET